MNIAQPSKAIEVSPLHFFLLTYALSWLIWIPLTLSHFGIGPFDVAEATSNVVRLLGVLMPAMSAGAFLINVFFLLLATLGEEIGWRGVALPALQQRDHPIKSSLILGLLWSAWHLPFWLLLDSFDQFGVGYLALNFLFVVPLTLYMTWFFNHSQQSILLPVAFHLSFNIVNTVLLPVTLSIGAFLIFGIFEWIRALALLRQLEPAHAHRFLMDRQTS